MDNPTAIENLLKHHMGASFQQLAPLLQEFHTGKQTLVGEAEVEQGNIFARIICKVMGFPRAGSNVSLRVECDHGPSMYWRRFFNGKLMASTFALDGNSLVEKLSAMHLYLRAVESSSELHYHFYRAKLLGLPLPAFLCPKVVAYEKEVNGNYQFFVQVKLWLIGPVIRYWGILELK